MSHPAIDLAIAFMVMWMWMVLLYMRLGDILKTLEKIRQQNNRASRRVTR